jgi:hypothetical protein
MIAGCIARRNSTVEGALAAFISLRNFPKTRQGKQLGLFRWWCRGLSGPIVGNEIDAPKMRCWGKEFQAYTLPFVRNVAEINDPAFLLFLREGIGKHHDQFVI